MGISPLQPGSLSSPRRLGWGPKSHVLLFLLAAWLGGKQPGPVCARLNPCEARAVSSQGHHPVHRDSPNPPSPGDVPLAQPDPEGCCCKISCGTTFSHSQGSPALPHHALFVIIIVIYYYYYYYLKAPQKGEEAHRDDKPPCPPLAAHSERFCRRCQNLTGPRFAVQRIQEQFQVVSIRGRLSTAGGGGGVVRAPVWIVSAFPLIPIFEIPGKLQAAGLRPGSRSPPLMLGAGIKSRCQHQRAGTDAR